MEIEVLGYKIQKKADSKVIESVVPPSARDGSTVVDYSSQMAGYYSTSLDLEGVFKNENEQIAKYRNVATHSQCDSAIDEIINEIIVSQDGACDIELNLDDSKLSPPIKEKINNEFKNIVDLLGFKHNAYEIVKDWYIDARLCVYPMVDKDKATEGIKEIRFIDPRKIKKIKKINKKKLQTGIEVITDVEEFFLFNDKGVTDTSSQGVRLHKDSVVFIPCGYIDKTSGKIIGYLHKVLKPVTSLKYIEDASVIYTITRAPLKRIFYIDVGMLNKAKAEQYVEEIMTKYRNKIVYDAATGEVKDDRKHSSMLEDIWMPRRDGNKGTEITTLEGSQSLITSDLLEYFKQELLHSLNVPISRLRQDTNAFNIGRSSEITRDEVKFSKFIDRLRNKFSELFTELLKLQLISKGIMSLENWTEFKKELKYDFKKDNLYAEMKENDILMQRLNSLQIIDQYVGKYYSADWVRKNILRQTDKDIKEIDGVIEKERSLELDMAAHKGEVQQKMTGESQ